jgi:uncharacterized protein (TIGR02186 family)
MKKYILTLGYLVWLPCFSLNLSSAETGMITAETKQSIEIGTRFAGERIYFFGTVPDPGADVVVKLASSQDQPSKLMRKGKVVLFWMGVKQFEVQNMPHIYKIHSSRPLSDFVTPELSKRYKIGYEVLKDAMEIKLLKGQPSADDKEVMFKGFLKMKEDENLYRVAENRIRITKGRLFEHYFTFPDKAKEGDYLVESYAIKEGKVIGTSTDVIEIRKVGFTAWLYRTAQNNGILYGVMAVCIALGAGLLVGSIFKGGGH